MTRSIALLLALTFTPSLASADGLNDTQNPESVRITYDAPARCPTWGQFLAQVASRVSIDWLANDDELARHIYVTVEPLGTEFVANLRYKDEAGHDVARSVQAPNCEQAVAGIALVCAIAIETRAARPDAFRNTAPAIQKSDIPPSPPVAQTAPQRPAPFPSARPQRDLARPFTYELGAHAGVHSGVGPVMAYGGGIDAGLGRLDYPTLRVSASWYEASEDSTAAFLTTQFRLLIASSQLCHGRLLHAEPRVSGALCVGGEIGQYRASGQTSLPSVFSVNAQDFLWAALQLAVPLRVSLYGGFLEFQPLVRVPVTHGSFDYELSGRTRTPYRVPWLALGLNFGLGFYLGG